MKILHKIFSPRRGWLRLQDNGKVYFTPNEHLADLWHEDEMLMITNKVDEQFPDTRICFVAVLQEG